MLTSEARKIILRALIPGQPSSGTKLDTAYLEFVNGAAVPPVEINPSEDAAYYDRLGETADRDYIRVKILAHQMSVANDGLDTLTFVITTTAKEGVHGKPFSAVAGSRVYGVALLASQANEREDLLFLRHYYDVDQQAEVPSVGSVMVAVDVTF